MAAQPDLPLSPPAPGRTPLGPGAAVLHGYADLAALLPEVRAIAAAAPFRHLVTPGGHTMSVAMTNCGALGWVSDRRGYRYERTDPQTGRPWPPMPAALRALAEAAAAAVGFPDFAPDACLVNRYVPGARLTMHQDRDEGDLGAPIVSVSIGLPAVFLWGGLRRADRPRRLRLESGDVVVWGGPSRLVFHGVDPLPDGDHPLTGACRFNLTFRRAA
ncbi:MAG: alpha-ketoglutarate-dependent dioxygenase AlkB [Rhodospirillales bacterium 69-11]|nr:DNA oxidative demethylase AlkB [Rhodospirillales bacterium]OJW20607.1 MAG: alpha-ketoglutarate-dependent dioxygenase AlkB [Rhodospirillales bacterium 69-11]